MSSDSDSKEFVSGQTITMTMSMTPELHSMMKEWSARVPTLYMLDICVVGVTKLNEDALKRMERKAKLVEHLRYLDREYNSFSYLFALMEKVSDSRGLMSLEELETQVIADLSALRAFFEKARVIETDDFVISFLRELQGQPIELSRENYLHFIKVLNNKLNLLNPVSSTKRLSITRQILKEAELLSIYKQHPVVIIAIACVYGNSAARKLMKFKSDSEKFDAENALADILLISRFAKVKLEIEHCAREGNGPYARVNFLTDDNGLIDILKYYDPQSVKYDDHAHGRESKLEMTVKLEKMLSMEGDDEYAELFELLYS
ncbi:hypothetical protein [Shewanella algae]|uniref:hypothetical protein n=1 Tax=Shewanella algae TaxID=38313 RepID=UPI000696DA3F|nr:hypothetical protein [Shewanella algae]